MAHSTQTTRGACEPRTGSPSGGRPALAPWPSGPSNAASSASYNGNAAILPTEVEQKLREAQPNLVGGKPQRRCRTRPGNTKPGYEDIFTIDASTQTPSVELQLAVPKPLAVPNVQTLYMPQAGDVYLMEHAGERRSFVILCPDFRVSLVTRYRWERRPKMSKPIRSYWRASYGGVVFTCRYYDEGIQHAEQVRDEQRDLPEGKWEFVSELSKCSWPDDAKDDALPEIQLVEVRALFSKNSYEAIGLAGAHTENWNNVEKRDVWLYRATDINHDAPVGHREYILRAWYQLLYLSVLALQSQGRRRP